MTPGDVPTGLSVVVPTYNRAGRLRHVLSPLLTDPAVIEIVVVDDASTDSTRAVLDALRRENGRVRSLSLERNLGPAGARNAGVRAATCELVLLIDDDVVAAPRLASGHLRHHRGPRPTVVLGYMPTDPDATGEFVRATTEYAADYEKQCLRYEADPDSVLTHLWGGNLSLPRDQYLAVVDEPDWRPLRYHEDRDMGLRLRARGVEARFDRSLVARHEHRRTLQSYLRDARAAGHGLAVLHARHGEQLGPLRHPTDGTGRRKLGRLLVAVSTLPIIQAFYLKAVLLTAGLAQRRGDRDLVERCIDLAQRASWRDGVRKGTLSSPP